MKRNAIWKLKANKFEVKFIEGFAECDHRSVFPDPGKTLIEIMQRIDAVPVHQGCYPSSICMPYQPHADVDFIRDTSAEALSVFYEIQRKRPAGQKLIDVFDLSEGLFEMAKAGLRIRYPLAGEREVFLRAVASRVTPELMIQAYGWDPTGHE